MGKATIGGKLAVTEVLEVFANLSLVVAV